MGCTYVARESNKITIHAHIAAPIEKVWKYRTTPEHITQWNFADPSWQCPWAKNDLD
ncbi:MAG: SRPBCC domain-containing protein [Sphingobacteriales bacterium]